jgi:hypothetical protein
MYGDQNSIIFDDNQILFNIDKFSFNNQTSIDFTNLQLFKFDSRKNTRIHLDQFNSQHVQTIFSRKDFLEFIFLI